VALLIGYLMTLYHSDMRHRLLLLYDRSIRDGLTGSSTVAGPLTPSTNLWPDMPGAMRYCSSISIT
jgi:hypothetical protein